ncbi:MAG: Fic family protein [archaeon]
MFVEKRGKKHYLVHSYRVGDKVKRISRYLGSNLNQKKLEILRKRAEELIKQQLKENILEFAFSDDELKYYQKLDKKIEIVHLDKQDWKKFTEKFTYNTNAIEGSNVAYPEVQRLLSHEEKPDSLDDRETLNVAEAVDYIRKTKEGFSLGLIKELHKICFKNTKSFAGNLRAVRVVVMDGNGKVVHEGVPPKEVKKMLLELVDWYKTHKDKYPPLLLAAVVHNQFENIHPFQDGNGRVGRLLLNYVLLKHKYPPINILLKDRQIYYKTLQLFEKAGDVKPTLKFLITEFKKQYNG